MRSTWPPWAAARRRRAPSSAWRRADHTLGDKIHAYANLLARHEPFTAPQADLTTALNSAQTLANSLEILGDAQPTQANYNQVLNTFNINAADHRAAGRRHHAGRLARQVMPYRRTSASSP